MGTLENHVYFSTQDGQPWSVRSSKFVLSAAMSQIQGKATPSAPPLGLRCSAGRPWGQTVILGGF